MTSSPQVRKNQRARVSAVVLLREDGAALFQHRDNKPDIPKPDMWVFPGGHQDEGETSLACAMREFTEETGYHCHDLRLLTSTVDYNEITRAEHDLNIYWAFYDGVQALHCFEGQELRFICRAEAYSYSIPECLLEAWDQTYRIAFGGSL